MGFYTERQSATDGGQRPDDENSRRRCIFLFIGLLRHITSYRLPEQFADQGVCRFHLWTHQVAPNKVAGFAVVKVLNGLNLLPIAAFFVPVPLQYVAGLLPTYWPMRALWSAATGEPYVAPLFCGAIMGALALAVAAWVFDRRLLGRG